MSNWHTPEENDDDDFKSKSQVKREFKELQELGRELVGLSNKQLAGMPLSEKMLEMVIHAKTLKHGVLNRQLRFIGSSMPEEDVESIRTALEKLKQPHLHQVKDFQELEHWRDCLLNGDQEVFNELAERFENLERQYINQLVRNAKKEQEQNKPPKSARLLFQYLKELKETRQ